jgi:hypothetical protein
MKKSARVIRLDDVFKPLTNLMREVQSHYG